MAYPSDFATTQIILATIASGQTTSAEINLTGATLVGIFWPVSMTGTTLKLQAAPASGGTFGLVQKDETGGGDYTITVAAGKYTPLTNLAIPKGLQFIKLVSGSSEGADRAINLAAALV